MGLKYSHDGEYYFGSIYKCRHNQEMLYSKTISHLDVFKVECHFAVFTVERSRFTLPLNMSVQLCTKDRVLAGVTLHPLEFTATFMLSLKMEEREIFPYDYIHTFSADVTDIHCSKDNITEKQLYSMVLRHICMNIVRVDDHKSKYKSF